MLSYRKKKKQLEMPTEVDITALRIDLQSFPFFYLSSVIQVLFLAREKCLAYDT